MQKKPGQISKNTLSLRFMQNAARAKQEKEVETTKAKVKSQEEWEISSSVREGWGIGDSTAEEQIVTYEQSYLPFLFPRLSRTSATIPAASTSTNGHSASSQNGPSDTEDTPQLKMKGRRIFGKHGKEEIPEPPPDPSTLPPQPEPSLSGLHSLSRGARSNSSRGQTAVPSSTTMKRPAPPAQPSAQHPTIPAGPPVFMKPQVDVPRAESGERKRRPSDDTQSTEAGQRRKKKRRDVEV